MTGFDYSPGMSAIEVMRTSTHRVAVKEVDSWVQQQEADGWAVRQIVANPQWSFVFVVLEDNR